MELTEFLLARLDEDEQTALQDPHPDLSRPILSYIDYGEIEIGTARVLAQVAAMRAIVEFHESWPVLVETEPELSTATDDTGNMTIKMAKQVAWMTEREYRQRFGDEPPTAPMLCHLAAIWDWHPDYDPAWSPSAAPRPQPPATHS